MDCCELALHNAKLAQNIAIGAFGTISLLLLMFFGYNLRLDKRTIKLEKKNGKEQHQIDELQEKIKRLTTLINVQPTNIPVPSTPPLPKTQLKPNKQPNSTDFLTELKNKQQTGKMKPSDFKDKS